MLRAALYSLVLLPCSAALLCGAVRGAAPARAGRLVMGRKPGVSPPEDISAFVAAVIQAERVGGGIATTLLIQSEQRLTERFQRAEKQALEAPVKLVFPLVVFIFPVTFLVLMFPIAMKFLHEV